MQNRFAKFNSSDAAIGYLYLLNALLYVGIWFVYLFAAQPENISVLDAVLEQLTYSFSEANSNRWFFVWIALAPAFCCLLSIAYLFQGVRSPNGALKLLVAGVAVGVATVILGKVEFAIFISVPIVLGWRRFVQVRREQGNVS